MPDLILRNAWKKLDNQDLVNAIEKADSLEIDQGVFTSINRKRSFHTDSSKNLAESYGAYYRETFLLYQSIINTMKVHSKWFAISRRSNEHSLTSESPSECQISGYHFDVQMFNLEWVDHSLQIPFQPWNLKVDFFSECPDEQTIFLSYDLKSLILGETSASKDSRLKIYNLPLPSLSNNVNYTFDFDDDIDS